MKLGKSYTDALALTGDWLPSEVLAGLSTYAAEELQTELQSLAAYCKFKAKLAEIAPILADHEAQRIELDRLRAADSAALKRLQSAARAATDALNAARRERPASCYREEAAQRDAQRAVRAWRPSEATEVLETQAELWGRYANLAALLNAATERVPETPLLDAILALLR